MELYSTLSKLLEQSVKDGMTRVSGVTFGFCDPEKLADEARQKAVADARRRAELYASSLGVKLGSVKTLTEEVSRPRVYAEAYSAGRMADANVPVERGQVDVSRIIGNYSGLLATSMLK